MRRFAVLMVLMVLCVPSVVHAETVTIDDGPPKGVVGSDGVRCTGTVTVDGFTLKQVEYSAVDAEQLSADWQREKQWSRDNCKWQLEQGMSGYFRWTLGKQLDVGTIRVTYNDV